MHFTVLTLFPEMFESPLSQSIVKRAQDNKSISLNFIQIRDFATDKHKSVDDKPYGGGAGMIMRVDIIDKALSYAKASAQSKNTHSILLDPRGTPYTQTIARTLSSSYDHLILLCGHYEGVDERVRSLVDEQISIGDYILTGGELPAMIIIDSVTRLLEGVIHQESSQFESFEDGLEYPQYTRPEVYNNQSVPDVLRSGNHQAIKNWRKQESVRITKKYRPELLRHVTE